MCNLVVSDKAVQGTQVVPDSFRDNADAGAAGEGGILVHHIGVKAVTGERRHTVPLLQMIVVSVPDAEIHQIAMLQHAAFGRSGGTRGVEQDVQAFRLGAGCRARGVGQVLQFGRCEHGTLVISHQWQQFFVGNQELGTGIPNHKVQALRGIGRIQRLIGAARLHGGQGGLGHPGVAVDENAHHLFFLEAESQDSGGQGICNAV